MASLLESQCIPRKDAGICRMTLTGNTDLLRDKNRTTTTDLKVTVGGINIYHCSLQSTAVTRRQTKCVQLGTARYSDTRVKTRGQGKRANILHSTSGVLKHPVCLLYIALCSYVMSCSTALLENLPVV